MKHSIDSIFPITLFFIFSAAALVLLLFSANIYENVIDTSESTFEKTTTLSYIAEKIRHNDEHGSQNIQIESFDGHTALAISNIYNETTYKTYIYESNGELKELFVRDGIHTSADFGTTIIEIEHLDMKALADNLFQFTCTASDGSTDSLIIATHSQTP